MLRYIILIIQFCCHLLLMSGLHLQNCPDGYLIFQQNYFWITKFWPAFKLFRLTFRWRPKLDPSLSRAPNWVEIVSCVPLFTPFHTFNHRHVVRAITVLGVFGQGVLTSWLTTTSVFHDVLLLSSPHFYICLLLLLLLPGNGNWSGCKGKTWTSFMSLSLPPLWMASH